MMGALIRVFRWGAKIDPSDPMVQSNIGDFFDLLDTARQMIGW